MEPGFYHEAQVGCMLGFSGGSSWLDDAEYGQFGFVSPQANIAPAALVW